MPIEEKTTESQPLAPIAVTVVGTGSGKALDMPGVGLVATTPAEHQPNVLVNVISPVVALSIRFANMYLTILVGLVAAGMTSDAIPYTDFASLVWKCAGLSVAGAGLDLGKNLITIFGRLESRYPLLTGNV